MSAGCLVKGWPSMPSMEILIDAFEDAVVVLETLCIDLFMRWYRHRPIARMQVNATKIAAIVTRSSPATLFEIVDIAARFRSLAMKNITATFSARSALTIANVSNWRW